MATCLASAATRSASGKPAAVRQRQHLAGRVGSRPSPRPAAPARHARRPAERAAGWSSAERAECRSRCPCASLASLAKPPARVTRGTGWRRRYFSVPPAKSPMSSSAIVRQRVELLHRPLGGRAGGRGDMVEAGRPRHVDAAMDRVDPGGAAEGHHDAGRAQDRQPADDAQAPVEGLLRQRLAARDGDRDRRRPSRPRVAAAISATASPHHLPRHRVDRGLAGRDLQARDG